jgi:low molecular weight phosphotyrosine protein phosphatase
MAEAVFKHQLAQRGDLKSKVVKVDSCGTGAYHVGDDPDERTVETCNKVGPLTLVILYSKC